MALSRSYPVALMVTGQPCLVVGGGPAAARKVGGLVASGAHVTVVAPEVTAAIDARAARVGEHGGVVAVARRRYSRGEAGQYRLVVAATGLREVDRAVVEDAEAAGVWVNCAGDAELCSFMVPSVHRQGPVTVAVSTAGASPALAAWIRRQLAALVGPGVSSMATMLDEARRELHASGRSTEQADWSGVLDGQFPCLVAAGDLGAARAMLRRHLGLAPETPRE